MKRKTKIIVGILLLLIAGGAMVLSLKYDDYTNSVPFGVSATGRMEMTPFIGIYFLATLIFVMGILPIKKIKKMPRKKKLLFIFLFVFLYIHLIFFIIFGFLMLYVFILVSI